MKSYIVLPLLVLIALLLPSHHVKAEKAPHEVGGFALGADVSDYPDLVTTNFLKEVVVTDFRGFRKGIISYGVCKYEGTILKIRMKYEKSSKKYFKQLLHKFKKEYGPPDEWKGDSFGILHIWKWHFTDSENRKVSMTLQHNLRNPNENIGNMVKLSYPDLVEEERECFNQICDQMKSDHDKKRLEELKKPDEKYLIPR